MTSPGARGARPPGPSEPANEEQPRHRWQFNDPERIDESWIIEEGGEPIG
ncbi:MAG TPA: hypothetical protein VGS17_01780 [Candidatus Limnocylindria bacterium]|nr:hypothetical protein [Candidatus Limnocylindria bacterium]